MKRSKILSNLFLSAILLAGLPGLTATPQKDTIGELEAALFTLSNYNYGEPETWKPVLIEVMQSVYQKPEIQKKAASLMRTFLNSKASNEAKQAVRPVYYNLTGKVLAETANKNSGKKTSASPLMIQVAALNERFESSKDPVAFIQRTLSTTSTELRPHVIRLVRALPDSFRKGVSFFEIDGLNAHNKAQLLKLLAARKDPSIHDLVTKFAHGEDQELGVAALEALKIIGKAKDLQFLSAFAASREDPEKSLARDALYQIPGEDVDQAIVSLFESATVPEKIELLTAVEKRNMVQAFGVLLNLATSEPDPVKTEAIRTLATTAPISSLEAVIEILIQSDSSRHRKELETAIYRIAARYPEDHTGPSIIRKKLQDSGNEKTKASLSSILEKLSQVK